MSGTGMYDHVFWFVYDKYIVIFIQNIQRNIFGEDIQNFRIRDMKLNIISGLSLIIGFDDAAIYEHLFFFEKFLNIRTGMLRALIRKITVDPYIVCGCIYVEF